MDEEHDREELNEGCCPSCGNEFADLDASRPVCGRCDERFDRELAAYLDFVAACREPA
jgi:protein-arginine kinase activator protein McsA